MNRASSISILYQVYCKSELADRFPRSRSRNRAELIRMAGPKAVRECVEEMAASVMAVQEEVAKFTPPEKGDGNPHEAIDKMRQVSHCLVAHCMFHSSACTEALQHTTRLHGSRRRLTPKHPSFPGVVWCGCAGCKGNGRGGAKARRTYACSFHSPGAHLFVS